MVNNLITSETPFSECEDRVLHAVQQCSLSLFRELEEAGLIEPGNAVLAMRRIGSFTKNQLRYRWIGDKPERPEAEP